MAEPERATRSGGESAPGAGKSGKGKAVIKRREMTSPRDPQVTAKIRERAYVLFRAGGCQHGHDLEHWLEAERQIIGGSDQPKR
jgi:hypothetical protein